MNDVELRCLVGLYPDARVFGVYDTRGIGQPTSSLVRPRPWAENGARVWELADLPGDVPVMVIVEEGVEPDDRSTEYLTRLGSRTVVHRLDGQLWARGELISDQLPRSVGLWTIRLRGRGQSSPTGELVWNVDHFPVTVTVRVPGDPSAASLHVEIEGPDPALPEPCWFRLRGPHGKAHLTVDISPDSARDRWSLSCSGRVSCEPSPPPTPKPFSRLIVVFDRTCPDRESWLDARQRFAPKSDAEAAMLPDSPDHLNVGIREGLDQGLQRALKENPEMPIDIVWFADVAGDGIVKSSALDDGQEESVGRRGPISCDEVGEALASMGYRPGLDLWDPLDRAIADAAGLIKANVDTAVVIVGNSPPNMPREAANPFWQIITSSGVPSGFRRTGFLIPGTDKVADFQEALDAVDKAGGKIAYVFLAGHQVTGGASAGNRFESVQSQVRDALERYLPVIDAKPDRSGVEKGVVRALGLLRGELSRVSIWKENAR